jgi:two-component system alkaline phosphatase synthesis response regulator PhoP
LIYLVEDEMSVRELILYTLNSTGLEARGFEDGKAFWQAMAESAAAAALPSLIILDIMLPGEDGLSVLKRLRSSAKTDRLPVIMLTAKGGEYDKVLALESGADDYMVKPAGMMELVARTRALLRRAGANANAPASGGVSIGVGDSGRILSLGGVRVDVPAHRVTVGGLEVALTLKEFDLLSHLLRHENTVFSREQLLRQVWGFDYTGETRTVDTHILTLRGKLGSAGSLIKTVRGLGYKIGGAS